ncbi:MAG: SIMPL domain-containing protein [Chloroflexi bacterium]|nr:SIMPL domain-containing protein [Chloroflexota bacterium]
MLARFIVLLTIAVLAVSASVEVSLAQTVPTQPSSTTSGISVVGQGIVLAQPTTAHITIGVDLTDPSLANAQSQAAQRMAAVVASLKANGIADTDIQTVGFAINPQYDNSPNGSGTLRGFQVQNMVDVKTTNVSGLGSLIDAAVAAGASRVYGINFQAEDDIEGLKSQARDQAMQNARAKAEQLATASGVALGKPILVEESDTSGVTPQRQLNAAPAAAPQPTTPVQPGQLQVSTTVRVVWSIQ